MCKMVLFIRACGYVFQCLYNDLFSLDFIAVIVTGRVISTVSLSVAFLARLSAASFPCIPTWAFTHWSSSVASVLPALFNAFLVSVRSLDWLVDCLVTGAPT